MVDEPSTQALEDTQTREEKRHPAGGWGSISEVKNILMREGVLLNGSRLLLQQNKSGGFACVSCAWAKPAHPHPAEFCENGAKATAWEITSKSVAADFFAAHSVTQLLAWDDHDLEAIGD